MDACRMSRVAWQISSCEVKVLRINNTVEHDVNLLLQGFKSK